MAAAAHHLHLDPLLTLPSIPSGHAQWANTEFASALVVPKLGHGGPDGVVRYGKG